MVISGFVRESLRAEEMAGYSTTAECGNTQEVKGKARSNKDTPSNMNFTRYNPVWKPEASWTEAIDTQRHSTIPRDTQRHAGLPNDTKRYPAIAFLKFGSNLSGKWATLMLLIQGATVRCENQMTHSRCIVCRNAEILGASSCWVITRNCQ